MAHSAGRRDSPLALKISLRAEDPDEDGTKQVLFNSETIFSDNGLWNRSRRVVLDAEGAGSRIIATATLPPASTFPGELDAGDTTLLGTSPTTTSTPLRKLKRRADSSPPKPLLSTIHNTPCTPSHPSRHKRARLFADMSTPALCRAIRQEFSDSDDCHDGETTSEDEDFAQDVEDCRTTGNPPPHYPVVRSAKKFYLAMADSLGKPDRSPRGHDEACKDMLFEVNWRRQEARNKATLSLSTPSHVSHVEKTFRQL